jgi:hypothetical protein
MRGTQVLTAVIIGAASVISGCGQQHPGTGAAAAPSSHASASSGSASPAPVTDTPRCPGGQPAGHGKLTITAADGGKSFCVTRGTAVTVFLKSSTVNRKWMPIHVSSRALVPHANGELTLALGVTGASFLAVQPGSAVITSGRPACGPGVPPGDGAPTMSCDTIIAFRVTVTVVS